MRLKLANWDVVFREIPDEVTLALNLSECPHNCKNCHSPELRRSIGEELSYEKLERLIAHNNGITCISFMGGDAYPEDVNWLAKLLKQDYDLKVAWYSGSDKLSDKIDLKNFDYIKIGPYIESNGPLDNPNTNQKLYQYSSFYSDVTIGAGWRDITYKFWNK